MLNFFKKAAILGLPLVVIGFGFDRAGLSVDPSFNDKLKQDFAAAGNNVLQRAQELFPVRLRTYYNPISGNNVGI